MLVYQAYRFELDPNNHARSVLASHAGAAQFAYNWGLDLVSNHLAAPGRSSRWSSAGGLAAQGPSAGPMACSAHCPGVCWRSGEYGTRRRPR